MYMALSGKYDHSSFTTDCLCYSELGPGQLLVDYFIQVYAYLLSSFLRGELQSLPISSFLEE